MRLRTILDRLPGMQNLVDIGDNSGAHLGFTGEIRLPGNQILAEQMRAARQAREAAEYALAEAAINGNPQIALAADRANEASAEFAHTS